MKKKILTFIFALSLIIPCGIMLTACGKDPNEPSPNNAVSVTIDFILDEDFQFGDQWSVDEATNTYTTTYLNGFVWGSSYMFEVVATTENGDTRHLYEVTEQNTAGYKVETNMPDTNGRLPVGTYTYKLYCESFNNGIYKTEACESETYTIIIEKEPIELEGGWQYNGGNSYHGDYISVDLNLMARWQNSQISLEDVGITNLSYVDEAPYTRRQKNVGDYTAKVEYEADTANFNYIGDGLPEKEFEWSIEKGNVQSLMGLIWNSYQNDTFEFEYGTQVTPIYSLEELSQNLDDQNIITLTGLKVNGVLVDSYPLTFSNVGTYTVTPVIVQNDTENYEVVDYESAEYSRTWTITKKKFNASDFTWSSDNIQPYTGWPQTVRFNYPDSAAECLNIQPVIDIDNNITNEATNAGTYTAKITYTCPENYEIIGTIPVEYVWTIPKAELTFENASWHFDFSEKTQIPYHQSYSLRPQVRSVGFPVTYTHYDSQRQEVSVGYLECGTYKTVATVDYDTNNYYLEDTSKLEFEWSVVKGDYVINWADWKYYSDINTNEITIEGNNITLQTLSSGKYHIYLDLMTTPFFSFKYSFDGGQTFVEQGIAPNVDAAVAGNYTITIVIEELDLEHYNPIDATTFTLNVNIVEA
ncbi:hypothetical protein IJD15_02365 [bacterium]|nr:hypothetical protein [bacterium]